MKLKQSLKERKTLVENMTKDTVIKFTMEKRSIHKFSHSPIHPFNKHIDV